MIKSVIFVATMLAIAGAQPRLSETGTILSPTAVTIGQLIRRVPTAVSHQSQTVVHNHANVASDILAPVRRIEVMNPPRESVGGTYRLPIGASTYLFRPIFDGNVAY